jgi:UDP-glucose:glycoprotein glucosyltransferase
LTPEAIHQLAIQTGRSLGSFQDASTVSFAEMYLALHAATPKIEAHYQYYSDSPAEKHKDAFSSNTECGSWVEWYGEVVCDLNTLTDLVDVDPIDSGDSNA